MLVSLSVQSARAKRKGCGLLMLPVSALEQATAAVRAAETQKQPIVLIIDTTKPMLYGLELFANMLLTLGNVSSASVSVIALCAPNHIAAEQAISAGVQGIIPLRDGASTEQLVSLLSWCSTRASARNTEVFLSADKAHELHALLPLLDQVRLAGVLTSFESILVNSVFTPSLLKDIQDQTKLPIYLTFEEDPEPKLVIRLVKAGVQGIVVSNEFDDAFTAGVRTALRNRSISNPVHYLGKGGLAVEDKIVRYLTLLCSM